MERQAVRNQKETIDSLTYWSCLVTDGLKGIFVARQLAMPWSERSIPGSKAIDKLAELGQTIANDKNLNVLVQIKIRYDSRYY